MSRLDTTTTKYQDKRTPCLFSTQNDSSTPRVNGRIIHESKYVIMYMSAKTNFTNKNVMYNICQLNSTPICTGRGATLKFIPMLIPTGFSS